MILRQQNVCLNIGEESPDFKLPDQDGKRALFVIDKKGIIRHIQMLSGDYGACPDIDQLLKELETL